MTGKVDYRSIVAALVDSGCRSLSRRKEQVELNGSNHAGDVLRLLAERGVRLFHIYSEGDESIDYLPVISGDAVQQWNASGLLPMEVITGANHTFTLLWSQDHLLQVVQQWMQKNMAIDWT